MSVESILHTITTAGDDELTALAGETEIQVRQILAEAEQTAADRQEAARQTAVQPVAGERARCLHQAKLEALQIVGAARDEVVAAALARVRRQLLDLRHQPAYARIMQCLAEEAARALGEDELHQESAPTQPPQIMVDPHDEALLSGILRGLGLDLHVSPTLDCWGGVEVHSSDGRIIVTNTLEARLERAMPYLRQELAAFFSRQEMGESNQLAVIN